MLKKSLLSYKIHSDFFIMETIINFLSSYISYWPITVFIALLLAGINFPISEDAIIIISAGFCQEDKSILVPTLIAIYTGVVISDCMSYFTGFAVSRGLLNFKKLKKMINSPKAKFVEQRILKHGFVTFITTRFVPFGARNLLFITSGLLNLNFKKFIIFDSVAALISNMTLFWTIYYIGNSGSPILKVISMILLCVLVTLIIRSIYKMHKFTIDYEKNHSDSE